MDLTSWLLYTLTAVAAAAAAVLLYRRREPPGRGRPLLGVLRALVLALVLLLVFDPELPAGAGRRGGPATRVLLDASLSMSLPAGAETRWQAGVAEARRIAGRDDVILFGETPMLVAPDSLPAAPSATGSRLLPALQAAAEAGARRVVVVTDGGIEDATAVARWLPGLGVAVEEQRIGGDAADLSLAEVDAPAWAQAGEPLDVRVAIGAAGATGPDSVRVTLSREGRTLAEAWARVPDPGRLAPAVLRFEPEAPPGGGPVRYEIKAESGDAVADDDTRTAYIFVTERPSGIALVSFRPDWEPRFLLPVLERALGMPARGFLRVAGGRWVQAGEGAAAGEALTEQQVRDAVALADLVVLHGVGAGVGLPDWAENALSAAPRLIVLPTDDASGLPLPIELGRATGGEWSVAPEVPPSPVAPLLDAAGLTGAPPLAALHTPASEPGWWAPLLARRGRAGAGQPLALAAESAGRRLVLALGEGYWRWAFRGGESRNAYARLWSALGGWVVREQSVVSADPVRPARRAVPRGAAPAWIAAGLAADSVRVTLTDAAGQARDTVLTPRGDTAVARSLPPGRYTYRAVALAADSVRGTGEGEITVESWSPDYLRPVVALEEVEAGAVPVGARARGPTAPLHASPWPYLAILLLLSAEWVLRRRWGLR